MQRRCPFLASRPRFEQNNEFFNIRIFRAKGSHDLPAFKLMNGNVKARLDRRQGLAAIQVVEEQLGIQGSCHVKRQGLCDTVRALGDETPPTEHRGGEANPTPAMRFVICPILPAKAALASHTIPRASCCHRLPSLQCAIHAPLTIAVACQSIQKPSLSIRSVVLLYFVLNRTQASRMVFQLIISRGTLSGAVVRNV